PASAATSRKATCGRAADLSGHRLVERLMSQPADPLDDPVFREAVRLTAYFLWEQDGRPEGRHEDYWLRALEKHRRTLEYDHWLDEEVDGRESRDITPC